MVGVRSRQWISGLLFWWDMVEVKYIKNVLDETNRKTRRVMKMNKKQYLKSDIDSLYVPRTVGGRTLIVCKLCVKVEENQKQHST